MIYFMKHVHILYVTYFSWVREIISPFWEFKMETSLVVLLFVPILLANTLTASILVSLLSKPAYLQDFLLLFQHTSDSKINVVFWFFKFSQTNDWITFIKISKFYYRLKWNCLVIFPVQMRIDLFLKASLLNRDIRGMGQIQVILIWS